MKILKIYGIIKIYRFICNDWYLGAYFLLLKIHIGILNFFGLHTFKHLNILAISKSKTTITFTMASTFSHMLAFDYNDFLIDWFVTCQIFSNIFLLFSKTSRFHILLGNSSRILSLVHTVIY